jgi:RNA-directed DNA polymerase
VPEKIGGGSGYYNLELLHTSCHILHHQLMEKNGGGWQYRKIKEILETQGIKPDSKEGTKLVKSTFKDYNYSE